MTSWIFAGSDSGTARSKSSSRAGSVASRSRSKSSGDHYKYFHIFLEFQFHFLENRFPPPFWIFYLPPKLYDMCLCGAAKVVNGFVRWIGKINYVSQWIFGLKVSKRMPFDVQFFIFFQIIPKFLKIYTLGHWLYCLGK